MGRHSSSGSHLHPYQKVSGLHRFWHTTHDRIFGYSQDSKDDFDRQADAFIIENSNAKRSQWNRVTQEWLDKYGDPKNKKK